MEFLLLIPLLSVFAVAPLSFLDTIFGKFRDRLSLALSFLPALLLFIFYYERVEVYYRVVFSQNLVLEFAFGVGGFSLIFGLLTFLIAPLSILLLPKNAVKNPINSRFHVLLHCGLFGSLIIFCAKDFIGFFMGLGILSWCMAGMLCITQSVKARGYLFLIIAFEFFVLSVMFCCFIFYGSSGSFLVDKNTVTFNSLTPLLQGITLFSFFSGVFVGAFSLSLTGFFIFYGLPRALIFFFVAVLYQIPIFTLIVMDFILFLPYINQFSSFWELLGIVGSLQIIIGYMGMWFYRHKTHELKLFLLNLAESGFLVVFLSVLDRQTLGGFMLLLVNYVIALALVYFVSYYQASHTPTIKPIIRLRKSWLGFFALANFCGLVPFFGSSGKIFLLSILWDREYLKVLFLLSIGLLLGLLFFLYRLKEFSIINSNLHKIPNSPYAIFLIVALLLPCFFPFLQYEFLAILGVLDLDNSFSWERFVYPHIWVTYIDLMPFLFLWIVALWGYLRLKRQKFAKDLQ